MRRLIIRHKGCGCLFRKPGLGTTFDLGRAQGYTPAEAKRLIANEPQPREWEAVTQAQAKKPKRHYKSCYQADTMPTASLEAAIIAD